MSANLENLAVATGLEKVSIHSNPEERQCQIMFTLLYNCVLSHASKVMLKILQARFQQYVIQELPHVQAGFRKGRETRVQIANIHWIIKKARGFQKNIYFCFIDYVNCGKFFKRWEYQTTLLVSWETYMWVKKQQSWAWNNCLVQNWERSTTRLHIVTLLI